MATNAGKGLIIAALFVLGASEPRASQLFELKETALSPTLYGANKKAKANLRARCREMGGFLYR